MEVMEKDCTGKDANQSKYAGSYFRCQIYDMLAGRRAFAVDARAFL
jgi:hypothetical protein